MKKLFHTKKFYKKILILCISIYVVFTFVNQQKTLNSYTASKQYYAEQIEAQTTYKESLYETRTRLDSKEYIEQVAREKLDMYLPNERIYVSK